MKFLNFFLLLWVIFDLLDPDPDSEYGSGSTDLIESGSGSETLIFSNNRIDIPYGTVPTLYLPSLPGVESGKILAGASSF